MNPLKSSLEAPPPFLSLFNSNLKRLGRGGGLYDQFFKEKGSLKIFLPPQHQQNGLAKLLLNGPNFRKVIKIKKTLQVV